MRRFIDIETTKNSRSDAYYAKKTYEAPSNYKNQEAIDGYITKAREKDAEKSPLYWWTGQIVCVCVCDDHGEGESFSFADRGGSDEEKEKALLIALFRYLDTMPGVVLIGKESKDFDFPYLVARAMVHDIGIVNTLRNVNYTMHDINDIFSMSRAGICRTSLANYAWGLGIAGKSASPQDVQAWHKTGQYDLIEEYCMQDCRITAEVFKRYNKLFVGGE